MPNKRQDHSVDVGVQQVRPVPRPNLLYATVRTAALWFVRHGLLLS